MILLPSEILHQIFLLFDQQQKVECMLVCRHWAHVITTSSLFHTVRMSSMSGLNKLVDKIQREPEQGTKVHRLVLNLSIKENFDMSVIPALFPNIRVFYLYQCENRKSLRTMNVQPWYKYMETMGEYSGLHLAEQLLASSMCSNLKKLSINVEFWDAEIIPLLVNAPSLTELRMTNVFLTIDDLEVLHMNLPRLQTMIFRYCELNRSRLPTDIQPAPSVMALRMNFSEIFEKATRKTLLQYIGKKYTNLAELTISEDFYHFKREEVDMLYTDGWIPLFQSLGAHLKTLRIDPQGVPSNLFALLDDAGCRIENIQIDEASLRTTLASFKKSRQSKYIQSLVLMDEGKGFGNFDWLEGLSQLRQLKLICLHGNIIHLNDLLQNCLTTLESLSIESGKLEFNIMTDQLFHIKELSFCLVDLPKRIDTFLSQHFPKLNTLKLDHCGSYKKSFILPMIKLEHFEVMDTFPPYCNNILVQTLKDDKIRWYTAKHKIIAYEDHKELFDIRDAPVHPAIQCIPYNKVEATRFMTLMCNSVRNLVMIDKR
ncbi:hypothetical protein K501DRAFT_274615 [Backusella circina FSU 941]|nr:hypothetical protein K501DRAFT_274615 [Backusella circina FSU 941]